VAAVALLCIVFLRRIKYLVVLAALSGLLIGMYRGGVVQAGLQAYAPYYKREVTALGRVAEDTSYGVQGDQRFKLAAVRFGTRQLPGIVWVSTASQATVKRGDIVTVRGALGEGFANISASMFRAQLIMVAHPHPGDIGRQIRDWFATGIRRAIPEPQASLGVGYVVGQRSSLPPALDQQLRIVGLTHAVVASGYNLTILVGVARRLFMGVSKYLAALAGVAMMSVFMLMTGFSPSMTRAGLVSSLSLAAWYYGRAVHPLVLLPVAAAITVLVQPSYIWGDIGWFLSFMAFAGVIVLAPLLQVYLWGATRKPGIIRQIVVDTTAAQLATMPIILYAFSQYSAYALPANVLVLPWVPLAMLCTFVAGIAGVLAPGLAIWVGWPATLILRCSTGIVGWFAKLPGAQGEVHIGMSIVVIWYVALLLAIWHMWRATGYSFRNDM
jgi:competence protein ComEC